jgi:hypothetical protein
MCIVFGQKKVAKSEGTDPSKRITIGIGNKTRESRRRTLICN